MEWLLAGYLCSSLRSPAAAWTGGHRDVGARLRAKEGVIAKADAVTALTWRLCGYGGVRLGRVVQSEARRAALVVAVGEQGGLVLRERRHGVYSLGCSV